MISRHEIRDFFERGWTLLPGVFAEAELAPLVSAFRALQREAAGLQSTVTRRGSLFVVDPDGGPPSVIRRVVWCGAAQPVLLRVGGDRRLLGPASQLLGSRTVEQLINQAHFKLPGDGVEFPWHQDSAHRRYGTAEWNDVNGRGSYVQTVLAIDDVTEDNGPIEFLEGSHRLGHVDDGSGCPPPECRGMTVRRPTIRRGSVLLFGPYVFHRSLPNLSLAARRVLINGYAFPGANRRLYPGVGRGRPLVAA